MSSKVASQDSHYYRHNVYICPSGLFSQAQLQHAVSAVGADRILFAADYPFLIDLRAREFLMQMQLSPTAVDQIAAGNAERLLHIDPR